MFRTFLIGAVSFGATALLIVASSAQAAGPIAA